VRSANALQPARSNALTFLFSFCLSCKALEASDRQLRADERDERQKDVEKGCFISREKTDRAAKLCFPNLAG
jgi:hypothetical protein